MNKRYIYFKWLLITGMSCFLWSACKDNGLDDFSLRENVTTTVSAGDVAGDIIKSSDQIRIPVKITLSSAAAKAFQVGLQLNADTVLHLIEQGDLAEVSAIPAGSITIPNAVSVDYGATEAIFHIQVSISSLEQFFGQRVALGYDIVESGKGNTIGSPRSAVIVFNTADILNEEEIHYVSITNGGGSVLEVRNRTNYRVTSAGLTIPLGISLAGSPGNFFNVSTGVDPDSVATLVANGILPANTVALSGNQYTFNDTYRVGSNLSRAEMDLIIPWSTIDENLDHTLAVVVKLTGTTRHLLDVTKSHAVILIYPQYVKEIDVTADGTLSVDHDNSNANEDSPKLVDGDENTKFLQPGFVGNTWFQLSFEEPQLIGAYTLTSANDAADRDLKNWNLQGSLDGINWVTLDTRTDETFAQRFFTKRYEFDATLAYKHYRLNVTQNNGSGAIQVAEWRLIRIP